MAHASIITIGDELLIGQTIDTNSAWMAQQLNKEGIWVRYRIAVGDVWDDIWSAIDQELQRSSIVLITGGLGPTADDITKPLLASYFQGKMIVNQEVLQHVTQIFTRLNRPLLERNLKQAEVPDTCTVLQNARGTAPGMWFEKEGKVVVSLPGVPHEMKGLMTEEVIPRLIRQFKFPAILHRTAFTAGQGESFIAERLNDLEGALPPHIKLAYLPNYGMVRLRLTARGENKDELAVEIENWFAQLREKVKDILVSDEDKGLEEVLGEVLMKKGKTMSTAESCTGGYIAHLITSIPGSSAYFQGSVVSYANSVKEGLLDVSSETLSTLGAVSEETVKQMVAGVLQKTNSHYALATSGIMGPTGGTAEKPVGTVWIAAGDRENVITSQLKLRFDRKKNIEITAQMAMDLLRRFILGIR
ncbi:MAG: competence/damage-inducible protein A [Chitinophagaceae bacterium]|nr:competence/damage-inducible protein A [Chitinophagaceae bacterium]